jgi:hypothetical protein
LLPLAVAAMRAAGVGPCIALAATIGFAHGTARAAALIRDISQSGSVGQVGPVGQVGAVGQLDLLLKTVYWRRLDGVVLLCVAATAAATAARYF